MRALRRFGHFWYDFLVGDDWVAAAGVAVAFGVTALIVASNNVWWLLPLAVAGTLALTVRRGARAAAVAAPPDAGHHSPD
jgi:hypothetical protein